MEISHKLINLQCVKTYLNKFDNCSHAVLLCGNDEILRENLARIIASKLVCEKNFAPCLMCANCKKAISGNAMDIFSYPIGKNIVVEDALDISDKLNVYPFELKYKIFILNNIDLATPQSQNKLLKAIEEPPQFVKFILTCANEQAVLPTILSRVEKFSLPILNSVDIQNVFEFNSSNSKNYVTASEFSAGNLTEFNKIVNDEEFFEIYNLTVEMILEMQNTSQMLKYSSALLKYKDKIDEFLEVLSSLMSDLLYIKNEKIELIKNKQVKNNLQMVSIFYSENAILAIINYLSKVKEKLQFNCSLSGVIDELLLKILEVKHICKK